MQTSQLASDAARRHSISPARVHAAPMPYASNRRASAPAATRQGKAAARREVDEPRAVVRPVSDGSAAPLLAGGFLRPHFNQNECQRAIVVRGF
jgi:hypothetical protein